MRRFFEITRRPAILAGMLSAILVASLSAHARILLAQESDTPGEETVANLAAGRVVIAVVKGTILVGTVENPIEAETRLPVPVPLASDRLGVVFGAVQWSSPSTQEQLARLDEELPRLRGHLVAGVPHLGTTQGGDEAVDIESVGQGVLERLNQVAQGLHGKVDMPDNEPLAEVILVNYLPGYGPDVWQLSYRIKQEEQETDYWTTRVLRPTYLQFWPPEKGQPRTLVEFSYPPDDPSPTLLDLLRKKDPRLEKLIASDPKMADVVSHFLQGDSGKIPAADATQFLRAALDAIAPAHARETMASISSETGFAWILPPPPEPKTAIQQRNRPADAPTLVKPPQ